MEDLEQALQGALRAIALGGGVHAAASAALIVRQMCEYAAETAVREKTAEAEA